MIKELGRVIKAEDQFIWVETSVKSSCSTCAAKSNCGTSAIAEAVAGKTVVNKVKNTENAKLDDQVEIGIPEETLLTGAFYLYLLPLVFAISGALVSQFWLSKFIVVSEGIVILATLVAGGLGFSVARYLIARQDQSLLEVKLLRIVNESIAVKTE